MPFDNGYKEALPLALVWMCPPSCLHYFKQHQKLTPGPLLLLQILLNLAVSKLFICLLQIDLCLLDSNHNPPAPRESQC